MFNSLKKTIAQNKVGAGAIALGLGATNSMAAVTMPTADYTNIESAAAIGFAVTLTVGLLVAARRFFRG